MSWPRLSSFRVGIVLVAVLAASLVVPGVVPEANQAHAEVLPSEVACTRAGVLAARDAGGPQVKEAAEAALVGGEEELCAFVREQWGELELVDREIFANQMLASGGPAMKDAVTPLLDAQDPEALGAFLANGWNDPWLADQEIRINQLAAAGGPQVKQAAWVALDAGSPEDLERFLSEDWAQAHRADVELRVNQALASGGPLVREAAARALDDGRYSTLTRFLDIDWGVAAARDHESETITDLVRVVETEGSKAEAAMNAAVDEADRAEKSAGLAKKAAVKARDEARAAGNDRQRAEVAASKAARAARGAAAAAGKAVGAANEAAAAAQTAANAAARVAMAAARAEQKAAEAARAAAAARGDRDAAADARDKAAEANAAVADLGEIEQAMDHAFDALDAVDDAFAAVTSAVANAQDAYSAAQAAAEAANAAGADAEEAYAAAARARAAAIRAQEAADEAVDFARYAREQAIIARDAAESAVIHARNAARAAEEAAEHAGDAADAAQRALEDADAASEAAGAARDAAEQAHMVFTEARRQDRLRLARERDQMIEAARDVARAVEDAGGSDAPMPNSPRAHWRSPAVEEALREATDPNTTRGIAVARAREAALGLVDSGGTWTREAARSALTGEDEQVLAFAREGLRRAEGMDDRTTLAGISAAGTEAMRTAAQAVLAGTDAEVASFLENPEYPERVVEYDLAVNQVLASARESGDRHTVAAATNALDDGSVSVLGDLLATGMFAAQEADDEIKVTQILGGAPAGSELRINAEVALEGPPAFREQFLKAGQYEAVARDQRTAAHVQTMTSLVAQAAEVAMRATENEKRAWEEAARAAGAAQDAANYAGQAVTAANEAGRHASAAVAAADEARGSAAAAKRSADNALAAANDARRSAQAAAGSAAFARVAHVQSVKFARSAAESAEEAWSDAREAGESLADAAEHAIDAYNAVYEMMEDAIWEEAWGTVQQNYPQGCRVFPLFAFRYDKGLDSECQQDVHDMAQAIIDNDFDRGPMMQENAEHCWKTFVSGALYARCMEYVGSLNFDNYVEDQMSLDALFVSYQFLEPVALIALDHQMGRMPDALCSATARLCRNIVERVVDQVSDIVVPEDPYSLEYWENWIGAWEEWFRIPNIEEVSSVNARMIEEYRHSACLAVEGSSGMSPQQCVDQRVNDALDDLSWNPPTLNVGEWTVQMTRDRMVEILSRQTWEHFAVHPSDVRKYFAHGDTVADLDRYLAEVVRHNEDRIVDYLEGRSPVSLFSREIDGHIYVVVLQRDGNIAQFYRW